jgi:hypothetical protein
MYKNMTIMQNLQLALVSMAVIKKPLQGGKRNFARRYIVNNLKVWNEMFFGY